MKRKNPRTKCFLCGRPTQQEIQKKNICMICQPSLLDLMIKNNEKN